MNSSRAFAYFGSLICSSISSHTFCHLGFSLTSCSISKHNAKPLFKPFENQDFRKSQKQRHASDLNASMRAFSHAGRSELAHIPLVFDTFAWKRHCVIPKLFPYDKFLGGMKI